VEGSPGENKKKERKPKAVKTSVQMMIGIVILIVKMKYFLKIYD